MSFRHTIGALLYDWPRYRRVMKDGRWILYRNREERIATDGRGVRCEWRFASDLHIAKVFPSLGTRLMQAAFDEWPVTLRDTPFGDGPPVVSFVIGHSGIERLPHLLLTLRSIAGQDGVPVECIVVEQAAAPEAEGKLPPWVRYVFLKSQEPYNRAATFNAGAAVAHAGIVIPHDNDILVPSRYAAEVTERVAEGFRFVDLKRFLFYWNDDVTRRVLATADVSPKAPQTISQNLQGGSIAATKEGFAAIGGFDEGFVSWGGEDNDFWDRAETLGSTYRFGYLPMIHLFHPPQAGKLAGNASPGVARYFELEKVPPEERIRRLHAANRS